MPMCTLCKGKTAVYSRRYSGESLCNRCFTRSLEDKVRATISEYNMLQPTDRIVIAVSGGKDSVTLAHILTKIEKKFPRASVTAVTIDEGIRGYRDEALRTATKICQELEIPHMIASFKEMYGYTLDDIVNTIEKQEAKGPTPCSFCGVLRRQALNTTARKAGADKITTAHTLDDETQTMLLNIMHGDAERLGRVKPILRKAHPKLVQRVKPFCELPEREVVLYAYLKQIDYQEGPCPYAGSALRNDARTMLNRMEEKHPGTKFAIFRSIERIRPALEAAREAVELRECRICGEPTIGETCKPCQMLQELRAP